MPTAEATVGLRWQAEWPGALWHGDVCHGAPLRGPDGSSRPLRIYALLDDATRYVVALQAFASEREEDMLALMVGALRRHGPSQALYLDSGPTYRGTALRLVCERLGTTCGCPRPRKPWSTTCSRPWPSAPRSCSWASPASARPRSCARITNSSSAPLTPEDTAAYVRAPLARVGCPRELFAAAALAMLHETTRGATREVGRIATAALRQAARGKRRAVDRDLIARTLDAEARDA